MKKILPILLIVFGIFSASAELRWGIAAGSDVSSFFWKQDIVHTHHKAGFNAGVMSEIMIPGIGFGVDLGVRYNQHCANANFGEFPIWKEDATGLTQDITVRAIQIPVNLRFKWTKMDGLEKYVAPFAYAGPVFSFTLNNSAKTILEHPAGNVGVQVGAGGEFFEHLQLSAGYFWGLSYEIRTIKLDNYSARPQGWNINLAYLF